MDLVLNWPDALPSFFSGMSVFKWPQACPTFKINPSWDNKSRSWCFVLVYKNWRIKSRLGA